MAWDSPNRKPEIPGPKFDLIRSENLEPEGPLSEVPRLSLGLRFVILWKGREWLSVQGQGT